MPGTFIVSGMIKKNEIDLSFYFSCMPSIRAFRLLSLMGNAFYHHSLFFSNSEISFLMSSLSRKILPLN
jgi:hypothetical protein